MAITERQFSHLQAMNIPLWIRKDIAQPDDETKELTIKIDFDGLSNSKLFQDILRCLEISIAEISNEQTYLNLGLFNWQFAQDDEIHFDHNVLTTPVLEKLLQSSKLKCQLWQVFVKNNLICQ